MYPLMPATIISDWQYASATDIADTTAVEVAAAPGAGKRNYVTGIQVGNADTAVGSFVRILSGSTVIANLFVGPFVAAAPGSSYAQAVFLQPLKGAVNEAINVDVVTTSALVRVSVQGFVATG